MAAGAARGDHRRAGSDPDSTCSDSLQCVVDPLNPRTMVDAIAQILGTVALTQNAHARSSWEAVRKGRADLTRKLDELGFDVAASQANFLLVSVPADAGWGDAQTLHAKLAERGVPRPELRRGPLRRARRQHDAPVTQAPSQGALIAAQPGIEEPRRDPGQPLL